MMVHQNTPSLLQSLFGRAIQAFNVGNLGAAAMECERVLGHDRKFIPAIQMLGAIAMQNADFAKAAECFSRVAKQQPRSFDAHARLGTARLNLGQAAQAVACYRKALDLKPDDPEIHYNLGLAFQIQERFLDAIASYRKALSFAPNDPGTNNNLGAALREQGQLDEAVACFHKAIELKPDYPEAHNNLGLVLQEQVHLDEAVACFRKAIELKPDYAEAHWNCSSARLLKGEFQLGWEEYEWRWKTGQQADDFTQPLWTGEESDGGTILLWEEQGLGDTIQFIRYASEVSQRGWNVSVVVQKPLKRLLGTIPNINIIARGEDISRFDVHSPLLSLPWIFGTTPETVPDKVPYLSAEPERVAAWRDHLPQNGMRVGIAWQGKPTSKIDRGRSFPLACLAPLGQISDVRLVSLQKHHGLEQLRNLPSGLVVEPLPSDFDGGPDAFLDTAAVMMNLDLIITSDTSIAHLAGALGRPVWVLLQAVPDWRWMMEREDSPWYPSMRLFRQPKPGDWQSVVEKVRAELLNSPM